MVTSVSLHARNRCKWRYDAPLAPIQVCAISITNMSSGVTRRSLWKRQEVAWCRGRVMGAQAAGPSAGGFGGRSPPAGDGETRLPHSLTCREGWWGAQPSSRGTGKPGFPISPPGGRVWAGQARPQGHGETGFPHFPARWEGLGGPGPPAGGWGNRVSPFPRPVGGFGRAQPSQEVCSSGRSGRGHIRSRGLELRAQQLPIEA